MTTPTFEHIPHDDFFAAVTALGDAIGASDWRPDYVVGIGRGGLTPAVYVSQQLRLPMLSIDQSAGLPAFAADLLLQIATMSAAGTRLVFVDDINDTGSTIASLRTALADGGGVADHVRFAVLIDNDRSHARVDYAARTIDRSVDKAWFVFPWEAVATDAALVADALEVPDRLG